MQRPLRSCLPSKKILIIGGVCVVAIVGAILWTSHKGGVKTLIAIHNAKKTLGTGDVSSFVNTDSDGDTIPDWEEPLWGTDPHNPDTDGDGISDGEEIEIRRKEIQAKTGVPNDENLNETDALSREFFGIVASLSSQGQLTDTALQNLAQSFVEQTALNTHFATPYTQGMLKVSYGTGDTVIRSYYTAMQKTLAPYLSQPIGLELQVIASGIYFHDDSRIKNLSVPAATYTHIGEDLMKITVPIEAVTRHLALANDFAQLGASLEQSTSIIENPAVGIAGIVGYKDASDALLDTVESLGTFFQSHGIVY